MEESVEHEQLRCQVEHLIQRGTPEEVVGTLRDAGADGVHVLQGGFGAPVDDNDERVSFAAYCLRRNSVSTWRAVIEANLGDDVDMRVAMGRTTARRYVTSMMRVAGNETTAAEAAIIAASPAGLRMVFELDGTDAGRRSTLLHPEKSLHHLAVARLLEPDVFGAQSAPSASGPADDFRRSLECCDMLRRLRAPWLPSVGDKAYAESEVMALFCMKDWPADQGQEAAVTELLRNYVLDGLLDAGKPLTLPEGHVMRGHVPLAVAGAYTNAPAIGTLIGLGQSTFGAVPPNSGHTDLLEYLRANRRGGAPACLAAAAEALLRRSLGLGGAARPDSTPPTESVRRRRAGL